MTHQSELALGEDDDGVGVTTEAQEQRDEAGVLLFATVEVATTGIRRFAECPWHSTKPKKHSAKGLPSVTLGI